MVEERHMEELLIIYNINNFMQNLRGGGQQEEHPPPQPVIY